MQYNYNTQGITSSSGTDPRNLGGSEGYGNTSSSSSTGSSSSSSSTGLMSSPSNSNDNDTNDEPSFFERIANLFSSNGGDLPDSNSNDDPDSGMSLYSGPMFTTSEDNASEIQEYLGKASVDSAMYEALGVANPEIYLGKMPEEEEPEPNIDTDVLQGALQPEPITVEEIDVKAGDTLSAIAKEKGVPLQDVIDANPQIGNPDLIRPGEKVTIPSILSDAGKLFMAATDPQAPAPVSEDPDRKFYQSGVDIEDRVFEGEDPRNLGGAEGYGSVGTPPAADAGLMTRPKARPKAIEASEDAFNEEVKTFVESNEGRKNTPYKDTKGLWTVGVGHLIGKTLSKEFTNLDGSPKTLSDREVDRLFSMDYEKHKKEAMQLPMYSDLDDKGKQALIDLTFNMGASKFNEKKWPKLFAALKAKDLDKAAIELEDSRWFTDVKKRAPLVIKLIKQAKFN